MYQRCMLHALLLEIQEIEHKTYKNDFFMLQIRTKN